MALGPLLSILNCIRDGFQSRQVELGALESGVEKGECGMEKEGNAAFSTWDLLHSYFHHLRSPIGSFTTATSKHSDPLKENNSISISTFSPLRKMGLGLVMLGLFCGRVAVSSHWFNMSLHWFVMSSYLFIMSSYWLIISAFCCQKFICVLNCAVSQNHIYALTVLARINPFCGRLSAVGDSWGA